MPQGCRLDADLSISCLGRCRGPPLLPLRESQPGWGADSAARVLTLSGVVERWDGRVTDGGEPDESAFLPELCDLCGEEISDGTEVSALVPDSSVIHGHDPKLDGKRRLTACSSEHMAALVEVYEQRPFVDAELWAGKIGRVIEAHRGRISPEELAEETGLTQAQIELGMSWQELDARRWSRKFGKGDGPESAG